VVLKLRANYYATPNARIKAKPCSCTKTTVPAVNKKNNSNQKKLPLRKKYYKKMKEHTRHCEA